MRKPVFLYVGAVLLASLTLGAGCPLIPDIEEKTVELAVGASTTVKFEATGLINTINETETVDFADSLDLEQILDDAGVEVDSVKSVMLSNVSYRVTRQDPTANRRIENATITIAREGGGAPVTLVSSFSEDVNSVVNYTVAPLSQPGVALINAILADLLREAQGGGPAQNTGITYTLTGQSVPSNANTDFEWELKIDLTIIGTVKVEVPS